MALDLSLDSIEKYEAFVTMDNKSQHGMEYTLKEIGNVVKKVLILKPDIMGFSKGTCFEKLSGILHAFENRHD